MIWLSCWADMIDRYAQMLGAEGTRPPAERGPYPVRAMADRATARGGHLRLASVDGALVTPFGDHRQAGSVGRPAARQVLAAATGFLLQGVDALRRVRLVEVRIERLARLFAQGLEVGRLARSSARCRSSSRPGPSRGWRGGRRAAPWIAYEFGPSWEMPWPTRRGGPGFRLSRRVVATPGVRSGTDGRARRRPGRQLPALRRAARRRR